MKPLFFALLLSCCVAVVYPAVTKTQEGYYMCTRLGDIMTVRARVLKKTDPVGQIRAVNLDGTDIETTTCPFGGDGSDATPWDLDTAIDCGHLPRRNVDGCGVRYDKSSGVTKYTWRMRTRQVSYLNCQYDIIYKITCDCQTAMNMTLEAIPITVDPITDTDATENRCTMALQLWNANNNAQIAVNGGTGFYRVVLGLRYSIRGIMQCPINAQDRVNPYGFYLKNVKVSNNPTFTGPDVYNLVNKDGCNMVLNGSNPFELSAPCTVSPSGAGIDWTYNCRTFQAASFQNAPQDMLYIGAEFEFCYIFGDLNCVRKCPPMAGRRKRSTHVEEGYNSNSTVGVVKIIVVSEEEEMKYTRDENAKMKELCEMDDTYITVFAVMGALLFLITVISTIMAICLVRMCKRRPEKHIISSTASTESVISAASLTSKTKA